MKARKGIYSYRYKTITMKKGYTLDKGAHSVYSLQYHFIQVVKYRKKIFTNEKPIDILKYETKKISKSFDVEVIDMECDKDHFHMIFKSKATLDIPKYINALKTISSRQIQRRFPEIKKQLCAESSRLLFQ